MDCVHTLVLFMERRLESVGRRAEAKCFQPVVTVEALCDTCTNIDDFRVKR